MLENLKSLTILYVEDSDLTRAMISTVLEDLVKKVYTAADGLEGLNVYKKIIPDIVITDMYMPNMDGIALVKEIKKISPKQIIAMFTADKIEEVNQKHSIKINSYMMKPLNRKQFFNTLDYLGTLAINKVTTFP